VHDAVSDRPLEEQQALVRRGQGALRGAHGRPGLTVLLSRLPGGSALLVAPVRPPILRRQRALL
jgi:hypothetical protein